MRTVWGRVRQTIYYLLAWLQPIEDEQACRYLNNLEYQLYMEMPRPSRQHHLRVLNFLLSEGHTHPSLLKAALLHDVGKILYPFGLFSRVLVVLAKAFFPQKFSEWGQADPVGWKRPFVVSAQHPAWSAEMAQAVGADYFTVQLIARHQTHLNGSPKTEIDHLLLLLQAADDRS